MHIAKDRLRPLADAPATDLAQIGLLFTDIDDTLTTGGMLTARAYGALSALTDMGIAVVPLTGRPAGWCDLIARQWPVAGVVGENGAFYFRYDRSRRRMDRRYAKPARERNDDRQKLDALAKRVLAAVPGVALAADQPFRIADLAIDHCEDVAPLGIESIYEIIALLERSGATTKLSSIHVNAWFGDYDKLSMARRFLTDTGRVEKACAFIGDSPNDEPLFAAFAMTVGVANIRPYLKTLRALPRYLTGAEAGDGFVEFADALRQAR